MPQRCGATNQEPLMTKKSSPSATSAGVKRKPTTSSPKSNSTLLKTTVKRVATQQSVIQPDASLSKKDQLIALLQSSSGSTIQTMTALTGWQAHTVRGVISAVLRKKLGLHVVCEKSPLGNHYKIVAAKA